MNYAIIGSGAIGAFYGGKLAQNGQDVLFLFHNDFEFVCKNGLKINSVNGDFHLKNIHAYRSTSEMPKCDIILVCLKTTNNHILNEILPPILHENSCVILIQNGLGLERNLSTTFPNTAIAGGLAFICCNKIEQGTIAHLDYGKITLGSFQGSTTFLKQAETDLKNAGIPVEYSEDLNLSRWKKLVWNIPFNGMTVVLNTTTNSLMKQTSSRQLIFDIMNEVIAGAKACGAEIPTEFANEMMVYTDKMTPYLPSMKLDFDNQRPMEIKAIYSNPIDEAKKAGIVLRKTEMLEQQLKFIQEGYLKK